MNHPLHLKALKLVREYKNLEINLIEVLSEIEKEKIYLQMHYNSMFQYCTLCLGLSESSAYLWIGISRKCQEVPELKTALESGKLQPSKARRILPVLERANSQDWIQKAMDLPQKALEREVVKLNRSVAISERIKSVCAGRAELRVGISDALEDRLKRCKEIVSSNQMSPASWEDVLMALAKDYLQRKDPVAKAERALEKNKENKQPSPKKLGVRPVPRTIPAFLKHQVFMKYRGECQASLPENRKCLSRRYLQIHHKHALSEGGKHELDNLILLCSAHHQNAHVHQGKYFRKNPKQVYC